MFKLPPSLSKIDIFSPRRIRLLAWLGVSTLFLGFFIELTWELHEEPIITALDRIILVFISHLRVNTLNGPAVDLTALGSPTVLTIISLLALLVLWLKRDWRGCAYLAIGAVGSGIGTVAMKHLFTRPRPDVIPHLVEVSGYSYPSGHSFAATSLYLLLMFLSWRYFRSWQERGVLLLCAGFLIAAISFSRLYLGVHYPSDVLGGVLLGVSWSCLLTAFFSKQQK